MQYILIVACFLVTLSSVCANAVADVAPKRDSLKVIVIGSLEQPAGLNYPMK
ncbi:MAG: hypothetical protein JNL32_05110, partial [Candidatus Kapabacteria bacterium]|nr:hypothetical protein [Candidatus Kapabacteria bacterium]